MEIDNLIFNLLEDSKYEIGIYIKDKNTNKVIKYNENDIFEAASCIKVFILVEFFRQVYENKISINDYFEYTVEDNKPGLNSGIISSFDYGLKLTSKDYVTLMIIYSDNIATNKIIEYLGIDNINNTIKELGFNNTCIYNELDLIKYHKFGKTTPFEYAKLFDM